MDTEADVVAVDEWSSGIVTSTYPRLLCVVIDGGIGVVTDATVSLASDLPACIADVPVVNLSWREKSGDGRVEPCTAI